MKSIKQIIIALGCLLASQVSAATIVGTSTLDLHTGRYTFQTDFHYAFLETDDVPHGVEIRDGDTIDWTVRFTDQRLVMSDLETLSMFISPEPFDRVDQYVSAYALGTMTLLNATGPLVYGPTSWEFGTISTFGPGLLAGWNMLGADLGDVAFDGIRLNVVFNSHAPGYTAFPNSFRVGSIIVIGSAVALRVDDIAAAVPEPTSWALMIIGFGFVGVCARAYRRKSGLDAKQDRISMV